MDDLAAAALDAEAGDDLARFFDLDFDWLPGIAGRMGRSGGRSQRLGADHGSETRRAEDFDAHGGDLSPGSGPAGEQRLERIGHQCGTSAAVGAAIWICR